MGLQRDPETPMRRNKRARQIAELMGRHGWSVERVAAHERMHPSAVYRLLRKACPLFIERPSAAPAPVVIPDGLAGLDAARFLADRALSREVELARSQRRSTPLFRMRPSDWLHTRHG